MILDDENPLRRGEVATHAVERRTKKSIALQKGRMEPRRRSVSQPTARVRKKARANRIRGARIQKSDEATLPSVRQEVIDLNQDRPNRDRGLGHLPLFEHISACATLLEVEAVRLRH